MLEHCCVLKHTVTCCCHWGLLWGQQIHGCCVFMCRMNARIKEIELNDDDSVKCFQLADGSTIEGDLYVSAMPGKSFSCCIFTADDCNTRLCMWILLGFVLCGCCWASLVLSVSLRHAGAVAHDVCMLSAACSCHKGTMTNSEGQHTHCVVLWCSQSPSSCKVVAVCYSVKCLGASPAAPVSSLASSSSQSSPVFTTKMCS